MFLLAFKPHVVWLLWPALLLYSFRPRRWRMLVALTLLLIAASAAALLINHTVFSQYLALWKESRLIEQLTPTAGGLLRWWLGSVLLQFLPAAVAGGWFLYYWLRAGMSWDWPEGTPLLLLVSMATAPYSWFFDQVVLLPSVLHGARDMQSNTKKIVLATASFLVINIAALTLILMHRTTFWYAWTAPAWLLWYLAVRRYPAQRVHQR